MLRFTLANGSQSIQEVCECCGEPIVDLHISDILIKPAWDTATVYKVKDRDGNDKVIATQDEFLADLTASYIKEGLMDESDAAEFRTKKKLKYGMRPEAMCSMSIDVVAGVTRSFCGKTDNAEFLRKYSSSFHAATEKETSEDGVKVGVDRKGNIIRMKSQKKIDLVYRRPKRKPNSADEEDIKYEGQFETAWFRALNDITRERYIKVALGCKTIIKEFGEAAVESGKVMAQFKTADDFKTYIDKNCG